MKQFTFTVNGIKESYSTVEEMREAINKLNNKGINVDSNSIKIETVTAPKTVNQLVKLIAANTNKEDLQEDLFVELVSYDIMKVVKDFSKRLSLTDKEYYTLIDVYGVYNYCNSKDDVRFNLLVDVITEQLDGNKINYTNFKKLQVKNSL